MKKSIFLFFAAILCAIGMNAATVTSDGTARLYFNLKAVSWWNAGTNGNGNFGYFFNNSTGKNAWSAHAVKHNGDTYYLVIPKGTWAGVILTRNNTSTAPSWDNKWNQTGDITLSSTSNYISKFSEGSTSVTWGTPVKPASNAAVSAAASTIFVGASTTLTPSLTSNADINDIKSTTYTISPNTGASVSGNTFTATAEGTYTITATVTYHPDGYSDTKLQSTATATTTITAEVPAEETHDVTISYMCGETKIAEPTTANTVGVETPVKVTAPEIAKYTFANWTLGADVATTDALTSNEINITTKAGGSDFTLTANYTEIPKVTVYFVNNSGWSKIQAYAWGDNGSNASWAGVDITANKLSEQIAGKYDVYSYTVEQGLYANVIFNNGSAQTKDYVWTDGNYYWNNEATGFTGGSKADAESKFSVPVEYDYVYFINTNSWAAVNIYTWESEIATWPGVAMNKEAEQIAGFDVYSHKEVKGTTFGGMKFNEGKDKAETGNLTWQAGKYYAPSKDKWYDTKEAAAEALATPLADETVYFVNNKQWASVAIYGWGGTASTSEGIGKWAGADMTKTAEQVAGFDVYSYTAKEGTVKNILFNYNGDENKTSNFVWTDGKYYYMGAAENYAGGTKEEVADLVAPDPLATEVYLAGDMTNKDNWDANKKEFRKATADATNASVTVTLEAQTYKFKLVIDGAWKGNTGTMQRGGDAVHEGGWPFDKDGYDDNCQIVADIAGDYTFTWNLTDKKLTVTYPPLPKYTVTATAENGSVTGAGEYEQGSEATLVATPDAGYAFKNWTKEGEEVSTEATYTFTVTANVELVANFVPEETHEVTVSYLCNATPIPGQTTQTLAVGVTTPSTISAPAITNYKFDSWTLGTGVQSEDDSKNPIQITTLASGEYTLAANYTKIELTYTVKVPEGTEKCYIAGDMNSWSFQEMTPTANANEFTITIDGATTDHKYKYTCGEGWAYVEKKADGSDLDADRTYNANDVVAKWAEPAKCYLMGIGGDWTTGIEMEEDGDQFKLLCQPIAEGEQFKFKYGDTWSDGVENHDFPGIKWVDDDEDGNSNITLPAGNYDFYYKKATNQVYIAAATDCGPATITLTTGNNDDVIAANIDKTVNVKIERSFTANDGFYTLCVPFKMDPSVIGKAYYLGDIKKHVSGESIDIELVEETYELSAGDPYLVLPKANMSELVVENVTIESDEAYGQNITKEALNVQIFFEGFYSTPAAPDNQTNGSTQYYVGEHGYLYNEVVDIRGLSGIFTITDAAGNPLNVRARVVTHEEVETGFENITNGENTTIKLIENGQLIIIRGGEKFNAQGQKL